MGRDVNGDNNLGKVRGVKSLAGSIPVSTATIEDKIMARKSKKIEIRIGNLLKTLGKPSVHKTGALKRKSGTLMPMKGKGVPYNRRKDKNWKKEYDL